MRKIGILIATVVVGPLLVGVVTGFIIVQTEWFRNFVREKLISAVETATGGRTEVGSFTFDWKHLRATVRGFVLHGTEPAGTAPLFRAGLLEVELKLLSPLKGGIDIASLLVDTPQANVIVYPDGRTNVPEPKVKQKSDKSALETIVDLAVRRFDIRNGSLTLAERKTSFDAKGENLLAHLDYNLIKPAYTGEISMNPLYLRSGPSPALNVNVRLPLRLEKDRVTVTDAHLSTPQSDVTLSATLENLVAPKTTARVNGRISIDEVRRAAGLSTPLDTVHGPGVLTAEIDAYHDSAKTLIRSARVVLGRSTLEGSGTLQDARNPASVRFSAKLAVGELGRLFKVAARPDGSISIGGSASLQSNSEYLVTANVDGRGLSFQQDGRRIAGIDIASAVTADPRRIELGGLRLSAMGGSFAGAGSLENMAHFQVAGNLRNFDLQRVAGAFLTEPLQYAGVVSGPVKVTGDINTPSALVARADLAVTPARRGVPVSGRLNVDYNGRADTITLGKSYLALPSTRIDLSGSLGQSVQVRLVSHNLNDFLPVLTMGSKDAPKTLPISLTRGQAVLTASIAGKLSAPRVTGHLAMDNFAVEGRAFSSFGADLEAAPDHAVVRNAVLTRGPLRADIFASVGLRNWSPQARQPLRATAVIRNADMLDVLALAGQAGIPVSGALTADARIDGTVGDPRGDVTINVVNGSAYGERFDSLQTRAILSERSIDIPSLQLTAGPSRLDATASYQHPAGDLNHGSVKVHLASNQVELATFQGLAKDRPGLGGRLSLLADATGTVQPVNGETGFQLTALTANASARGLRMEGKSLGDFTAVANTSGSSLEYTVNSDFAGSTIRVSGTSVLTGDHRTTATAAIEKLPIDRVLAVAGRRDIPVSGVFSAKMELSGTLQDPRAKGNFGIEKGSAYREPFDTLQAAVSYNRTSVDISSLRVSAGPSNLDLSANFVHPPDDLQNGSLRFRVRSNRIQVSQFRTVREIKPGLSGLLQVSADGAATLRANATPGVLFSTLNANIATSELSVSGKRVGDVTAIAETRGNELTVKLDSDFGHADVHGSGRVRLAGDYPIDAQLNFTRVTYSGLSDWLGSSVRRTFDASLDGQVTVAGPVTKADALKCKLRLTKLEAHAIPPPHGAKPRVNFELHNEGPIVASLDKSVVKIESARITGPFTNLTLTGTAGITATTPMNLRADGNIRLDGLQAFSPDIFSSGAVVLNAAVTGTIAKPVVNGRLQLQKASLNMIDMPNGIANAEGTVVFNGNQAVVQNITGESGGGKIAINGVVGFAGPELQLRLEASADRVRVRAPADVSSQVNARLRLTGTESRSLLAGNVTVLDVALHSHSDIGSMLSSAATPPSTPTESTGILGGMQFDVRIDTAPDLQVRTALTQNLEADAHLTLRGTPSRPGMLGRVNVTQGEVVFFGARYTIDQGSVAFYDPRRINPYLNVNLSTTARGVEVALSVAGPMDRLKLSYHSEPPLQFSEIVSLLASGKVPTADPVLAAQQPAAPQQSFQQLGASTLLGQAVANPVSGRLQRLFGVSKIKIDPQITGTDNSPAARLTIEQQISRDLLFTYIQDLTQSNPQILRVEWTIDPRWSAIAQRQTNGEVGLDLFYKKRFW